MAFITSVAGATQANAPSAGWKAAGPSAAASVLDSVAGFFGTGLKMAVALVAFSSEGLQFSELTPGVTALARFLH